MGVTFRTSAPIDLPGGLTSLLKDYSSVILATGTWTDRRLGASGEDLEGVEGCLQFLGRVYAEEIRALPGNVCVIGDGNAAFDAARACVRLGAHVTVLSWFPEELIPADPDEVRASREEGVSIVSNVKVLEFIGSGAG